MTREQQEAIAVLQEFYDYNKTLTPHGESWLQADITINRYTQEELGKALPTAIAALRGPQPDPDTGLAPCGCGGKAGFHYSVMQRDNDCCVACGTCGVHSRVALCEEEARDAWNRAMGWRESE